MVSYYRYRYNNGYYRKYYTNRYYRRKYRRYKTINNANSTYLKLDGEFEVGYIANNIQGIRFITSNYQNIGTKVTLANCFEKMNIWGSIPNIYNMMSIKGIKMKLNYNCTNQNSRVSCIICYNPYVNDLSEADIMDANDKYIYNGLSGENKNYYKSLYNVNSNGYKIPIAIGDREDIKGCIGIRETGEIKSRAPDDISLRVYTLVFTLYIKFFNSKK